MFVNFVIVVSVILGFVSGAISEKSRKICDNKYSLTCLKLEIVSFLERISDQSEYNLMSGVSVVKDNTVNVTKTAEIIAEVSRIFPADPNKRLDEFLIVKLNDYLKSHSLRLKLMDNEAMEKARDLFEGRKGKLGKKGGLETMIAAAMMMKGKLRVNPKITKILNLNLNLFLRNSRCNRSRNPCADRWQSPHDGAPRDDPGHDRWSQIANKRRWRWSQINNLRNRRQTSVLTLVPHGPAGGHRSAPVRFQRGQLGTIPAAGDAKVLRACRDRPPEGRRRAFSLFAEFR